MPDGSATLRDTLESVERQTGRATMMGPELPAEVAHLWNWFLELSAARGSNGWSANPLSYSDIDAWARLTGALIWPSDVRAILLVDRVFLGEANRAGEKRRQWQRDNPPGGRR